MRWDVDRWDYALGVALGAAVSLYWAATGPDVYDLYSAEDLIAAVIVVVVFAAVYVGRRLAGRSP